MAKLATSSMGVKHDEISLFIWFEFQGDVRKAGMAFDYHFKCIDLVSLF